MMVDWTISCPGKMAHVTALTSAGAMLVRKSPYTKGQAEKKKKKKEKKKKKKQHTVSILHDIFIHGLSK